MLTLLTACGGAPATPAEVGHVTEAPPEEEAFPIALDRDVQVGDRFNVDVHVVAESNAVVTQLESSVRELHQRYDVHLIGLVEILGVNPEGLSSARRITVERFTSKESGAEDAVALVPRGTVITFSSQPFMLLMGDPAAPAPLPVAEAFVKVMEHGIINTVDDAMFGSEQPRRVGEQWPAHDIVEVFAAQGAEVRSGEGEARIVSRETIDGVPALIIEGALRLNMNMSPNPALIPEHEAMALRYRFAVPIALNGQRIRQETRVEADTTYRDPSNGERMVITVRTHAQSQLTPAPSPL